MTSNAFNKSAINEFFRNKSVLITGGTGLVGKVLAFKIILSIESVKTVYLLIREKNGKNAANRFEELIKKSRDLFSYVDSDALRKLVPISGDASLVNLGLSATDHTLIIDNVSIVFHAAADITFESDLKEQLLTNVGGTKEIVNLCKQLKNLDALVYISTAYSNPPQLVTEEKVYENHQNPLKLLEIARKTDKKMSAKDYLGDFPNTYTFTKNLAESVLKREHNISGNIPSSIVRPGIVAPSYRDPILGWIDTLNGIIGAILMAAVGLARNGRGDLSARIDPIPVDIVANTCIAAAWTTATKYKSELRVYNCNSSCLGAPEFNTIQRVAYEHCAKYPLLKTVRPIAKPTTNFYMLPIVFHFIRFFSETCFAYLCDLILLCIGEKRCVVRIMNRLHKIHDIMQCFIARKWYFTNNCFVELSNDLVGIDKNVFDCDVRGIDWIDYFLSGYFTSRKIFLKEKDSDVERAQIRFKYLKLVYTIGNHLLVSLIWYLIISITPHAISISSLTVEIYNLSVESIGYYAILLSLCYNGIVSLL